MTAAADVPVEQARHGFYCSTGYVGPRPASARGPHCIGVGSGVRAL